MKFESEFILTDDEILAMGDIKKSDVEMYRRKHYQDSFGIGTWYDKLSEHTFPTISVGMSFEEGECFIKYYRKNTSSSIVTNVSILDSDIAVRKGLEKRLDDVLKDMKDGAFVKLNTRSPKDVPHGMHNDSGAIKILDEELKKEGTPSKLSPNSVIVAYTRAMNRLMRVNNGSQAFDLLSKSYRVYEDLSKNVSFGETHFKSNIEIREWIPEVVEHPENEFRCFVHSKSLNCCSQYFCDVMYPSLIKHKLEIGDKIKRFYDSIQHLIPHQHFVIDFFVGKDKVYIIELNPFVR